jgi:hypothetical protein
MLASYSGGPLARLSKAASEMPLKIRLRRA